MCAAYHVYCCSLAGFTDPRLELAARWAGDGGGVIIEPMVEVEVENALRDICA